MSDPSCPICDGDYTEETEIGGGETCRTLNEQMDLQPVPDALCPSLQGTFGTYCECAEATPDVTCRVCGGDNLLPEPFKTVTFEDTQQGGERTRSCASIEFAVNSDRFFLNCTATQTEFESECCGEDLNLTPLPTPAPAGTPTTGTPPTASTSGTTAAATFLLHPVGILVWMGLMLFR